VTARERRRQREPSISDYTFLIDPRRLDTRVVVDPMPERTRRLVAGVVVLLVCGIVAAAIWFGFFAFAPD
jgi:hypothetical protein